MRRRRAASAPPGGQVLVLLPLLTTAITPATHKHQPGVRVTTMDDNFVLLPPEVAGMGESVAEQQQQQQLQEGAGGEKEQPSWERGRLEAERK